MRSRATSPLVGTALLVVLTVLIAGTMGTVLVDAGVETSPTTTRLSASADAASDRIALTHDGGESVPVDELSIKVEGDSSETYAFTDGSAVSTGNKISATDSVVISVASTMPSDSIDATSEISTNNIDDLNSVKLVWESIRL